MCNTSSPALTVATVLSLTIAVSTLGACDSTTEPEEAQPEIVRLAVETMGAIDANEYWADCPSGPNSLEAGPTCPVIRWNGRNYWPLTRTDNKSTIAFHAFDAQGRLLGVQEFDGARYPYTIEVDLVAETFVIRGQADRFVVVTFAQVLAIG
ncbi:MAG: hypothetical protein R3E10_14855 [Gemmatimonadota bacterium]